MSEIDLHPLHCPVPRPLAAGAQSRAGLAVAALTSEQVALTRRIGRGCSTPVPQAGSDALLSLYLAPQAPAAWRDALTFQGPAGAIEVEQGARLIRGLCGIDLGDARGEAADWLQAAVLGRLHDTPFGGAERITAGAAGDTNAPTLPVVPPIVLRIVLRTAQHAIDCHARAGAAAWLDLLARAEWVRQQQRHAGLTALTLPVLLAHHTLPAAELRSLRTGDVILPASPRFTCDAVGSVSVAGIAMRVRYCAPCSLEILQMEEKLDDQYLENMDGSEIADEQTQQADAGDEAAAGGELAEDGTAVEGGTADAGGASANAAQVPVTLDFTLGHVRTTLAELDTLGAGSVLTLADGSPACVTIGAGGQVLGRGEAVEVDGRLGVRIVQWG